LNGFLKDNNITKQDKHIKQQRMIKDVIHAKIESLFLCGQSLKRNNVDRQINYTLEVINILVDAGASLYSRDVR
jgi:hypothetical protein